MKWKKSKYDEYKFTGVFTERDCPLCDQNNPKTSTTTESLIRGNTKYISEIHISYCANCHLSYQAPILPNDFFNKLYANYVGNIIEQTDRYDFELQARRRSALSFSRYIKNNSDFSILEIGCSSGYNLENIRKKYSNVQLIGVDLDEPSINYGRGRGNDIYIKDAFELNQKFDIVFLNHVFEHIIDSVEFLMKLKELLKTGGIVAINVPNSIEWAEKPTFEHVNYFSEQSIHVLMKKCNIKKYNLYTDIINDKIHVVPEIRLIIEEY